MLGAGHEHKCFLKKKLKNFLVSWEIPLSIAIAAVISGNGKKRR
jgi:hypothetical protein